MSNQQAATTTVLVGAPESLPEKRVRKATTRFREGWYSEKLPRLSLALGVGVAAGENAGAEGGALPSDDNEVAMSDTQEDDETGTSFATGLGASETLPSKRVRKATTRFKEGWYSEKLPRLSLALGVGAAHGENVDHAGTIPSDDNDILMSDYQTDDDTQTSSTSEEPHESVAVGASDTLPSKRVPKATTRFEEGWYSEKLPRLSAALGVAASTGQSD